MEQERGERGKSEEREERERDPESSVWHTAPLPHSLTGPQIQRMLESRDQQTFSTKGQIANTFGFLGHL